VLSFILLVQSKTVEISVTWYLERKYALATFSIVQPHYELPASTCIIYWLSDLPLCLLESWFPLVTEYQQHIRTSSLLDVVIIKTCLYLA